MTTRRKGKGSSKLFGRPDALLVEESAVPGAAPPPIALDAEPRPVPEPADTVDALPAPETLGVETTATGREDDHDDLIATHEADEHIETAEADDHLLAGDDEPSLSVRAVFPTAEPPPEDRSAGIRLVGARRGDAAPPLEEHDLRDIVETSRSDARVDFAAEEPELDAAGMVETIEGEDEGSAVGPVPDSPYAAVRLGIPSRAETEVRPAPIAAPLPAVAQRVGTPSSAPTERAPTPRAVPLPEPPRPAGGVVVPLRGGEPAERRPVPPMAPPKAPPVEPAAKPAAAARPAPAAPPPRAPAAPAAAPAKVTPPKPVARGGVSGAAIAVIGLCVVVGGAAAWIWGRPLLQGDRPTAPVAAASPAGSPAAPGAPTPAPAEPTAAAPAPVAAAPPPVVEPPKAAEPPKATEPPKVAEAPSPPAKTAPEKTAPAKTATSATAGRASSTASRLAAAESPAEASGLIRVKTDRRCLIMVNGRQKGYAPDLGAIQLPAGTHILRAVVQGTGQSRSMEVRVDEGVLREVEIRWD